MLQYMSIFLLGGSLRKNVKGKSDKQTIILTTRIDKEIGEKFKEIVSQSGENISDYLEEMIKERVTSKRL